MESFSTGKEFREYLKRELSLSLNINFKNITQSRGNTRVTGLFTGDIELLFRILERAATAKYREDFIAQTKNTNHLRNWLREAQRKSRDFESQLKKKEVELKAKKQIILQKNEKIEKLLKEGGQTRNLLNLEKMKNQKIKSLVEDDKIDEDLVKRRRINKGKAKINEITTVPVDPSLGQDEDNYTKESRNYTIYNIPWNLSDEEIYRLLTLEASKKMWLLSRMSIKRQKKYKTVKVTIKWVHSMDEAGKKTHIILNLRHKDRLIHICWYEGNLKLKDIKEYMKYKLYKNVEEEIKDKDQLELCRLYQEKYGLYYAQIIEVGGKPYLEATFPSKEQQKDSKETDRNLVLEMPVDLVTQQTSDPIETHKILDEREEIKIKAESKEIFDKNKGEKQKEKIKEENQEEVIDDVSARLIRENDITEAVIYIEAHFKNEDDAVKMLNKKLEYKLSKPWQRKMQTLSTDPTFTAYKETQFGVVKETPLIPVAEWYYKDKREEDVIMKPSDEEIKVLNKELDHVNESCSERLEKTFEEDNDLNENNKRKKTQNDTTYRAKFRAKEAKDKN
ncbi:hypothetical protein GLOIN_2v1818800 [Rhizophagus clarus]|uniref:Uncharacterized protein n=1 Tax=Rhizophagus clarus TaxID=94130 RepID=A0A8H3LS02_9GLOM|nr:hypothetical protein GLOIN_2v1818800 [Rhizophagus clarus]